MSKTISSEDPYVNLANAIVITAVDDYRRALRRKEKNNKCKDALHEVEELERFFRSEWYSALTSLEGEYLISKIRGEYEGDNQSKSKSIREIKE